MHNFLNIYQGLNDDATKMVYIAHFCPHFMDTESAGIPHGIPLFDTETDCENKMAVFVKKYNNFLNDNILLLKDLNLNDVLNKIRRVDKRNHSTLEIRFNLLNFPDHPNGFQIALIKDNVNEAKTEDKEKISESVINFLKIMKQDLKEAS